MARTKSEHDLMREFNQLERVAKRSVDKKNDSDSKYEDYHYEYRERYTEQIKLQEQEQRKLEQKRTEQKNVEKKSVEQKQPALTSTDKQYSQQPSKATTENSNIDWKAAATDSCTYNFMKSDERKKAETTIKASSDYNNKVQEAFEKGLKDNPNYSMQLAEKSVLDSEIQRMASRAVAKPSSSISAKDSMPTVSDRDVKKQRLSTKAYQKTLMKVALRNELQGNETYHGYRKTRMLIKAVSAAASKASASSVKHELIRDGAKYSAHARRYKIEERKGLIDGKTKHYRQKYGITSTHNEDSRAKYKTSRMGLRREIDVGRRDLDKIETILGQNGQKATSYASKAHGSARAILENQRELLKDRIRVGGLDVNNLNKRTAEKYLRDFHNGKNILDEETVLCLQEYIHVEETAEKLSHNTIGAESEELGYMLLMSSFGGTEVVQGMNTTRQVIGTYKNLYKGAKYVGAFGVMSGSALYQSTHNNLLFGNKAKERRAVKRGDFKAAEEYRKKAYDIANNARKARTNAKDFASGSWKQKAFYNSRLGRSLNARKKARKNAKKALKANIRGAMTNTLQKIPGVKNVMGIVQSRAGKSITGFIGRVVGLPGTIVHMYQKITKMLISAGLSTILGVLILDIILFGIAAIIPGAASGTKTIVTAQGTKEVPWSDYMFGSDDVHGLIYQEEDKIMNYLHVEQARGPLEKTNYSNALVAGEFYSIDILNNWPNAKIINKTLNDCARYIYSEDAPPVFVGYFYEDAPICIVEGISFTYKGSVLGYEKTDNIGVSFETQDGDTRTYSLSYLYKALIACTQGSVGNEFDEGPDEEATNFLLAAFYDVINHGKLELVTEAYDEFMYAYWVFNLDDCGVVDMYEVTTKSDSVTHKFSKKGNYPKLIHWDEGSLDIAIEAFELDDEEWKEAEINIFSGRPLQLPGNIDLVTGSDYNFEAGDGVVYQNELSEEKVNDIVAQLYEKYPEMNEQREAIVRYCLSKVGCEYCQNHRTGQTAPAGQVCYQKQIKRYKYHDGKQSFDCSGLAYAAYKSIGIDVGCGGIFTSRSRDNSLMTKTAVSSGDKKLPGDIIFYPGHVAVYIGNGKSVEAVGTDFGVRYKDTKGTNIVRVARPITN